MKMRPFILAVAVTAAGLSTFTAVGPAVAAEAGVVISYDDLNLGSAAGRAVLDRRIERAATRICGFALPVELDLAAEVNSCREGTIAAARSQLRAGEQTASVRVVRAAN